MEDYNLAVNTVDINSDKYLTEEKELARKRTGKSLLNVTTAL